MRIIQLPSPIDGFTHAKVTREIDYPAESLVVNVLYGTMDADDFVPSESRAKDSLHISGDEYTDLVEVVKATPGRPENRPNTDFWPSDVDAHFEEDPAVRATRIAVLKVAAEASADRLAEEGESQ